MAFSILSNILLSVFTVISIPVFQPFLEILFNEETITVVKPDSWNIIEHINYYLSNIVIEQGRYNALVTVCIFIVVVFLFKNLFRYLALFFMVRIRNGIITDLREDLFDKYLGLPLSYLNDKKKGDLISRLTSDVVEIEWSILNMIEVIFKSPIIMIGCIIYMVSVSAELTLFVLGLMLITVFIIGGISKTLRKSSSEVQHYLSEINSTTEEALGGLRIIKAFSAEKYVKSKFDYQNIGFFRSLSRLMYRRDLSSPLSEFLGVSLVCVLLWYGGIKVLAGDLNAAAFLTYIFAFYLVIEPSKSLSSAYYNLQKGRAALDRIDHVLQIENSIVEQQNAIAKSDFNDKILFEEVSFGYEEEVKVLDQVSLEIKKGQLVALVGSSGAGKSTLVDLLPRFFDVNDGSIKIDDVDIRNLKIQDLRNLFGIVSQEAILFNDSIRNNISFGLPFEDDEILAAAKTANIYDFILSLPDGLDTNIGDRGVKLSGGQRQRLTIARAILRNPPILILDEATSALDSESEKLVQEALEIIMKSRTSIVIAHRLSTIKNADTIFVMNQGKLVEKGTHQNLMNENGFYKKFVEMQSFES